MELTINKQVVSCPEGASLREIIMNHTTDASHIAVAVNHRVIPRGAWGDTFPSDGDSVSVITATMGG